MARLGFLFKGGSGVLLVEIGDAGHLGIPVLLVGVRTASMNYAAQNPPDYIAETEGLAELTGELVLGPVEVPR